MRAVKKNQNLELELLGDVLGVVEKEDILEILVYVEFVLENLLLAEKFRGLKSLLGKIKICIGIFYQKLKMLIWQKKKE